MDMNSILEKKKRGEKLDEEEIRYFVSGFTEGRIPDYQASAFLMAAFINGLDREETVTLTMAMRDSGDVIDLSSVAGIKVDKHSTGGVGDKTTLIAGPLAAACGVPVAKMSGRGLGFTGGTIDKLEAIPGFSTSMDQESFIKQVNDIGIALTGQTGVIAPADKKMYALRDVTATVDSLPLITSSIMSKKLASGSDAIVLDVKTGSGAFMKEKEDAAALARLMTEIGNAAGKKTMAVISSMEQPLGCYVGNRLEVVESVETLKGRGPEDLTELSLAIAGLMIYAAEKAESFEEGRKKAEKALAEGSGLEKFRQFIKAQGGDENITDDYLLMPEAAYKKQVLAEKAGYVQALDGMKVGNASQHSGAGRAVKEDEIDHAAGIILLKKTGDQVAEGEVLAQVCGNDEQKVSRALEELEKAYTIGKEKTDPPQMIQGMIGV